MSLLFLLPVILLIVAVLIYFSRKRRTPTTSGLGDRPDITERPEHRGTEQYKTRRGSGTSVPPQ